MALITRTPIHDLLGTVKRGDIATVSGRCAGSEERALVRHGRATNCECSEVELTVPVGRRGNLHLYDADLASSAPYDITGKCLMHSVPDFRRHVPHWKSRRSHAHQASPLRTSPDESREICVRPPDKVQKNERERNRQTEVSAVGYAAIVDLGTALLRGRRRRR
ncbi:hypothetical protein BIW11_03525 [Tropilaelaps mercedesae]|uniref:Uncharacterized protein n=1 Tax=Tropilaelaps mercedesae TaxID=418985 RepID=A0A1V9XJI8_9ACAR|nr:hypothetical protein BIW11_03525 [Tropilaelaps mercedesae]